MRIGVVACDVMKREIEKLLSKIPDVAKAVYLEYALHIDPPHMKKKIKEQIHLIKDDVDVVFLGYGFCKSLQGIEAEFDIPIVMPQVDDCISILLTPEVRAQEIEREAGTYFLSPGWSELGKEMVIKELHLDRARQYGRDPFELAKSLFTNYQRGLYIDTGVGDNDYFIAKAEQFCSDFNLVLEKTEGRSTILETMLAECIRVAASTKERS